jgi:hypothetical protein
MCPAIAGQFLLADQVDQAELTSCTFALFVELFPESSVRRPQEFLTARNFHHTEREEESVSGTHPPSDGFYVRI